MKLAAAELYRLRRQHLVTERMALLARLAHNRLKAEVLELERKYQLLATDATLDPYTGQIVNAEEEASEPRGDAIKSSPRLT